MSEWINGWLDKARKWVFSQLKSYFWILNIEVDLQETLMLSFYISFLPSAAKNLE